MLIFRPAVPNILIWLTNGPSVDPDGNIENVATKLQRDGIYIVAVGKIF